MSVCRSPPYGEGWSEGQNACHRAWLKVAGKAVNPHPARTHVVLGLVPWAGSYVRPCSLWVAKTVEPWSHPWRLGIVPFSLAATSGLITFLLDFCSSLPGLPTACSWPFPTLPWRALSSLCIMSPLSSAWEVASHLQDWSHSSFRPSSGPLPHGPLCWGLPQCPPL